MRLTYSRRLINKQQLKALKQIINRSVAEAPDYIRKVKNENKKIVIDNLFRFNNWYIRLIKLDQVELYQEKADKLGERLQKAQEKRRQIEQQLRRVTKESTEVQELLNKIDRNKEREKFLNLIKTEAEMLDLKGTLSHTLQDYVEAERETFTAYSNAVRGCYEKQKYQKEYTRYAKYVITIIAPILVAAYTRKEKIKEIGDIVEKKIDENFDEIKSLVSQNNQGMLSTPYECAKKAVCWAGSTLSSGYGYVKASVSNSHGTVITASKKVAGSIGSVPGSVYGYIKTSVPSYSTVTSVPKDGYNRVYNYFTGKK